MKRLLYKNQDKLNIIFILVYTLYIVVWHVTIIKHLDFGDSVDVFVKKTISWQFLLERYYGWSSRLLIEVPLIALSKHLSLFLVTNITIMSLFPVVLWRLFARFNRLTTQLWLVLLVVMFYPFHEMNSAGWIATLANYYYPLFFAILSLFIIADAKQPIHYWRYFALNACLLFACNIEQLCVVFVPLFTFLLFFSRRRVYYALPTLIAIASLVFIVLSPGNHGRSGYSIYVLLPDFINYSLEYKAYMGFQSTLFRYFTEGNLPFIAFLTVLGLSIYQAKGRSMTLLPLLVLLVLPLCNIPQHYVPTAFENRDSNYWHSYLIFSAFVYLCLHLMLCIYDTMEDKKTAWVILTILFLGFSARFVMGFSPTLFASDNRTFIFTDFSLLIATLLLIEPLIALVKLKLVKQA